MVLARQLSVADAATLAQCPGDGPKAIRSEEDVLRWLAGSMDWLTPIWKTSSWIVNSCRCFPRASC